jgi:transposase-like protein
MRKIELPRDFDTEEKCFEHLKSIRWPNGEFECRGCKHKKGTWLQTRKRMQCCSCGFQSSVTAGSLFHGTKVPLRKLFRILMDLLAGSKKSAEETANELGIAYATAWLWMLRIRSVLKKFFPPNKSFVIDLAVLGSVLFRRSRDSEPADRAKEEPPLKHSKQLPPLPRRKKKSVQIVNRFLVTPFQGISCKYAEHYVAQFSFSLRRTTVSLEEFLRMCLQSDPITRAMILSYSAPAKISLPLLKS